MLSKSMMRWLVELQEFDFSFFVEATSRATLADMLTYKDGPILVKEVEEKTAKEEQAAIPSASTLFFDGSYKRSLYQSIGGCLILDATRKELMRKGVILEASTNNEAKYAALMEGLFAVLNFKIQKLMIKRVSLLVVKQVLESW